MILLAICTLSADAKDKDVIESNIWQGTNENSRVKMIAYLPSSGHANAAVIICPGGSYFWLDHTGEGTMVAKWLQSQGIAAFILRYRTGGVPAFAFHTRLLIRGNRYPDMIMDVQRAIELLRVYSGKYRIDAHRIGVMGFSAGGHLGMMAAVYSHTDFLRHKGIYTNVSLRPDFVAVIYPVVTMSGLSVHKRSRRGLLSEWREHSKTMQDSLSVERHIPSDCPPIFIVNCKDDPVVDYHNSMLLDSALTVKGISHKYIQYRTGGHGFGMNPAKGSAECREWKNEFIKWFQNIFDNGK